MKISYTTTDLVQVEDFQYDGFDIERNRIQMDYESRPLKVNSDSCCLLQMLNMKLGDLC